MERKLAAIFSADVKGYSRLKQAFALAQKAVALDESLPSAHQLLGQVYLFHSQHQQAMRLNPQSPANYSLGLGQGYRILGRYEEAIATFKKALGRNPNLPAAYAGLAATYSELGREEEAQATAAELLSINPDFSLELWVQRIPFKDQTESERYVNALRKAGLK